MRYGGISEIETGQHLFTDGPAAGGAPAMYCSPLTSGTAGCANVSGASPEGPSTAAAAARASSACVHSRVSRKLEAIPNALQ